jgi:hypothetical protein
METTSLHAARIGSRFNLQPQASNSELNRLQPHLKDDGWAQYISPTEKIGAATFAVVSSFFRLVVLLLHKKQQNKLPLSLRWRTRVCCLTRKKNPPQIQAGDVLNQGTMNWSEICYRGAEILVFVVRTDRRKIAWLRAIFCKTLITSGKENA